MSQKESPLNPAQFSGMVRVGTVSSVNEPARTARVFFNDVEIMSGNLKILASPPFIPKKHVPQQTDGLADPLTISPWLPDPGDIVLCLYDGTFNGNGYILGRI